MIKMSSSLLLAFALSLAACSGSKTPAPAATPNPELAAKPKPKPPTPVATDVDTDGTLGAAWFLGADKKVKVCVESAPAFPVPMPKLRDTVSKAFQIWHDYVTSKKLAEDIGAALVPAFNPQLVDKCAADTDLKFAFGTGEVSGESLAVAQRTAYDTAKGWGKGWIGISPKYIALAGDSRAWTEETLLPFLLQKLGEVAGNDPVAGTIMDNRIQELVERHELAKIAHIDFSRELYVCADCAAQYELKVAASKDNLSFFHPLLGEKVEKGDLTLTLDRAFFQGWKQLNVKYEGGSLDIPAARVQVLSSKVFSAAGPTRVFRSYLAGKSKYARSYVSVVEVRAKRSEYYGQVFVTVEDNSSVALTDDLNSADDVFAPLAPHLTLFILGENGEWKSLTLTQKSPK